METMDGETYYRVLTYSRGTRTRCHNAAHRLHALYGATGSQEVRWGIGYYAADLLAAIQEASLVLVPLLNDDDLEGADVRAREVTARLRKRRLVVKMSDATGRTPAEAAAFASKAADLG